MSQVTSVPRIAVAGCGYWGANLVRNFAALDALAGVVDARPEVAASFAAKYNAPVLTWEQALASVDVEAVAIATPAETHDRLVKQALDAGKHVFVEKPLALRYAEGVKLAAEAERRGLVLMVGHLLQYHPAFIRLLALVRE